MYVFQVILRKTRPGSSTCEEQRKKKEMDAMKGKQGISGTKNSVGVDWGK